MPSYNKCIFVSITFLSVGFFVLIFGTCFLDNIIHYTASSNAMLKEETSDLWAYIPGKSKVAIYKDIFLYSVKNLQGIFFNNESGIAEEMGPYRVQEFDEIIDRKYSADNSSVSMKMWKYYHNPTDHDDIKQKNETVSLFNIVGLGVWYQAKHAEKSLVALKAMYTIYKGMFYDFYYAVVQKALQEVYKNSTRWLDKFSDEIFFTREEKNQLTYGEYGLFGNNNAYFVKAVLTYPSPDSEFLMNFFDLTIFEIDYLKKKFTQDFQNAFKGYTQRDVATRQWLDLSIKQDTVKTDNSTIPGYIEYGGFLKYLKQDVKSNLTYDQAFRLFFDFNDIGREPMIDDSHCLINKINVEKIFQLKESQAIEFMNAQLMINNLDEARSLYEYVIYISGEMAFNYKNGGTKGIMALSDFLSQGFFQVLKTMGWDLLYGLVSQNVYVDFFTMYENCEEVFRTMTDLNPKILCQVEQLTTDRYENIPIWVKGVLYQAPELKSLLISHLNITDDDYYELTKSSSKLVDALIPYVKRIQDRYNLPGNYKTLNPIPIAANQWASGDVTRSGEMFKVSSVKKWHGCELHYKSYPEYTEFCLMYKCNTIISAQTFLSIANFNQLFSTKWISNLFIKFYHPSFPLDDVPSEFYSRDFIRYLRYLMSTEVLNLFITKSAYNLIWGYEDEFLKMIKYDVSYFLGGNPAIDTKFALLPNSTEPADWNRWSFYTGRNQSNLTRMYKTSLGQNQSWIMQREDCYDGRSITYRYRNPWKMLIHLNGTDALSFQPWLTTETEPWVYLDELYRTGKFVFKSKKDYFKLTLFRYVLDKKIIFNKTLNPFNENYYSDKYNGFGNITSVFQSPIYASKPYYYQCDNMEEEMPIIIKRNSTEGEVSNDPEDVELYNESWVDLEPYSGAVIRAAQKLLISVLLESDELFEWGNKMIPVYFLYRSGNFSENSIKEIFGELISAFALNTAINAFAVFLIALILAISIYHGIKIYLAKRTEAEKKGMSFRLEIDEE